MKQYQFVLRKPLHLESVNKLSTTQKLLVFERKILSRISGPTKENKIWRIETNEKLN